MTSYANRSWVALGCCLGLLALPVGSQSKTRVFACEPVWAGLATAIAGPDVSVYSATSAKQDPHYVEARPSFLAQMRRADLVICTGAELENAWLPLLLRGSGNRKVQAGTDGLLYAADYVTLLGVPTVVDRSLGDIHPSGNPHFWTSFDDVVTVGRELARRLSRIDPDHAADYQRRAAAFEAQYQQHVAGEWRVLQKAIEGLRVVEYHNELLYLIEDLGLTRVAVIETKAGVPPTSRHLAALLRRIDENGADVIAYNTTGRSAARWLSKKSDIPAIELPINGPVDWKDPQALFTWYHSILLTLADIRQ